MNMDVEVEMYHRKGSVCARAPEQEMGHNV